MKVSISFWLLLALESVAAKEYWFDLTYVEDVNPSGLFSRRLIGVNGTWPPPPISVFQNETLTVHATNKLDKPTSLHHHGMLFPNTSYFDGAVGVTQCGIPVNSTFTYEIPVSSQPVGTLIPQPDWWHSHASGQYVDGLRAPFLIHPETEVHTYDEDITVILGDLYQEEHPVLLSKFVSVSNPTGAEPVPESALIYFAQNDTYLEGFNANASLNFVPGRTYRLRVINTSAFAMFHFWIDGHQMRIIEADGVDTEELAADWISMGVAQRYSVLVTALNTTNSNYYFHADFNPDMFDVIPDGLQLNYTANVVYDASAPFAPAGLLPVYEMFNDTALIPVVQEATTAADVTYNLTITFDTYDDGTNRGTFNTIVYNSPKVPSILSTMTTSTNASIASTYGNVDNNIVLGYNQTVDLVLWNTDAGMHPFHLHGHKFQIIGRSFDYTSDDPQINPTFADEQSNPMRRDTVQVPGGGYVTVRFRADNPGNWFFHCHIEWHLESGLAMTFIEAPELSQQWLQIPTELTDQCNALGVQTSGNAVGLQSATDLTGLKTGPFPQVAGFHAKGIAAMAMCCLTALLGVLTILFYVYYGDNVSDEEHYEEVKLAKEAKVARREARTGQHSIFSRLTAE